MPFKDQLPRLFTISPTEYLVPIEAISLQLFWHKKWMRGRITATVTVTVTVTGQCCAVAGRLRRRKPSVPPRTPGHHAVAMVECKGRMG